MLKKTAAALVTVAFLAALLGGASADTYKWIGGGVTSNTATDTTFTRAGTIPGNNGAIAIWNPDASCYIEITHNSGTAVKVTGMHVPADGDLQIIPVGFVDQVEVDKSGIQRVGVYFLGD